MPASQQLNITLDPDPERLVMLEDQEGSNLLLTYHCRSASSQKCSDGSAKQLMKPCTFIARYNVLACQGVSCWHFDKGTSRLFSRVRGTWGLKASVSYLNPFTFTPTLTLTHFPTPPRSLIHSPSISASSTPPGVWICFDLGQALHLHMGSSLK